MSDSLPFDRLSAEIVRNSAWYAHKHQVEVDEHFAAYHLIKEIGQFADAILKTQDRVRWSKRVDQATAKDALTQELVDIVALALINAHLYGIDIETGLRQRWIAKTDT
jgi:NTP pyrophosphatase (non-canonical NTP hydrolase)